MTPLQSYKGLDTELSDQLSIAAADDKPREPLEDKASPILDNMTELQPSKQRSQKVARVMTFSD